MQGALTSLTPEQIKEGFLALRSPRDVAQLLNVAYPRLIYHTSLSDDPRSYASFNIPKKNGGNRKITCPVSAIKIIQRSLHDVLQNVYEPRSCVYGFVPNRSIVDNANRHTNQKYVLNIDLADFFPSINLGRVRGLFMAPPYELPSEVATVLARLCCHKNELPQGAPTSPTVSNMICWKIDRELLKLANLNKAIYSRYADDMTFSTSEPQFPSGLASYDNSKNNVLLSSGLTDIVVANGFQINQQKVRLQNRYSRQEVTGLIVNVRTNVRRTFVRQLRAMLHDWETNGLMAAEAKYLEKYSKYRFSEKRPPSFRAVVRGKINYLRMVRGKDDGIYKHYSSRFRILDQRSRALSQTP